MATYQVRGRSVATAATADHAAAALWNPSTAFRITVWEIWVCCNAAPAAGAALNLRRITTSGTAGSTVTPTIENDTDRALAPPSGALLHLAAYTVQPTLIGIGMAGWTFAAVAASGIIMPFPRGIAIPPGTGLAITAATALAIPAADIVYVWSE